MYDLYDQTDENKMMYLYYYEFKLAKANCFDIF